ncbi:16S rRNA (guanine(966)-N(2))-methyltransferase RsmD [Microbacterium sp. Root53]|uniref:RsmD family RNA methyltransferase n=1 Tax=Microbacterium sp. Root53 TaxID=1736553 RepID=UPI0006F7301A|nr:RsmD family RNA methyltransferase [Microbacterium sp. Root53]KQY99185.1 16S rRNA (guanine(966)-N(2))-methyltransferase RsmD [Microbacterium sp. Root53]
MTRIIAGAAGGVRLDVPSAGTRPTSDRVRESLFAALEVAGALDGARVLDLYAGSGALGLEAASRGAAAVDLVERAKAAAAIARRNAEGVRRSIGGGAPPVRVHAAAVGTWLRGATGPFDLAFLDPPYDLPGAELDAVLAALAPLLSADAVVVVERSSRSGAPDWAAAGLEPLRDRAYGDTALWWGQPAAESQSR